MEEFGYEKSKLTLKNLKNNLVICPDDEIDLKIYKIFRRDYKKN